ncbi:MAG: hypothetical protein WBL95_17365 [Microcoleus sp.]
MPNAPCPMPDAQFLPQSGDTPGGSSIALRPHKLKTSKVGFVDRT